MFPIFFIITNVAYNATSAKFIYMTLDDIKKNLNAVADSLMKNPKKQVDSSVVLLLTIASILVLMMEDKVEDDNNRKEEE